jgi:tetratricopeptide (TPR) repeat protein
VVAALDAGDPDAAISAYAAAFGSGSGKAPRDEVQAAYALALSQKGRAAEALEASSKLPGARGTARILTRLVHERATWLFALGRREEARAAFAEVADDAAAGTALGDDARRQLELLNQPAVATDAQAAYAEASGLAASGRDLARARELARRAAALAPGTPLAAEAAKLVSDIDGRIRQELSDRLREIGALYREQSRFADARVALAELQTRYPDGPFAAKMVEMGRDIDRLEARYAETARAAEQAGLREQVERAERLLTEGKPLEAIAAAKVLSGTPLEARGREVAARAAGLYVDRAREEASRLVVAGRENRDREKKLKLFLSARGLLREAIDRFPENPRAERAKHNLSQVEQEIRAIDPAALGPSPPAP